MRQLIEKKLQEYYGRNIPVRILDRVSFELKRMEECGLSREFFLLHRLVRVLKSRQIPFYLGGEASSSILLYLLGASSVNPLQAHYYNPIERKIEFSDEAEDGYDLPDRSAPWISDGHNVSAEIFWGTGSSDEGNICPNISLRLPERAFSKIRRRMLTDAKYDGLEKKDIVHGRGFQCGHIFLSGNMALPEKEITWYYPLSAKKVREYELQNFSTALRLDPNTDAIPKTFLGVLRIFGLTRGSWSHVNNQRTAENSGMNEETYFSLEDFGYSLDVVPAFYDDVFDMVLREGYPEEEAYYEAKRVSLGRGLSERTKDVLYDRPEIPWCNSAIRLYSKAHALEYLLMDYRIFREEGRKKERIEEAGVRENK
ncbi:MAG: hypothetical protein PUC44_03005 [Eubacteriales bacterium]|nr:hypothetical protein [Eubacteriales bacterium]